jgi:ribonuclease-3 family protein
VEEGMKFDHFKMLVDMMFQPDGAGGVRQKYDAVDVKQLNPLVLAYVGDAYFHLFVRTRLLSYEQGKVQALHSFSAQIVSAVWQCKAYQGIEEMLTEEERGIYRRGRNANVHQIPKNARRGEYAQATALEALFGWLYLKGEKGRINELFARIVDEEKGGTDHAT